MTGRLGSIGSIAGRERLGRWPSARALLRALRPLQWTKNGVVFAALVFGGELFEAAPLARAAAAVILFCGVSSGVYLVNDLRDVAVDRVHPKKRHRPIAAGLEIPTHAILTAAALFVVAFVAAWQVRPPLLAVIAGYVALMVAYSYGLKWLVILKVLAIVADFVLRAVGGAVAIDVPILPWLYVCTMLLALFIGFGKRRHELSFSRGWAVSATAGREAGRSALDGFRVRSRESTARASWPRLLPYASADG